MKNHLKRVFIILFCMLSYFLLTSQENINEFVDEFENNTTHKNAVYENYNIITGALNILEQSNDNPDKSAFYINNKEQPLVARYNIYNASKITVSFYSSYGSFATKINSTNPIYFLGYNSMSTNTPKYPIYIYNRKSYIIGADNKVYTGQFDNSIFNTNIFKNIPNAPDPSILKNTVGVSITISDGDNIIETVPITMEHAEKITSSNLYYHTVSAVIPDGTEFITVSLKDIDLIYDDTNTLLDSQSYYSALASVKITGDDLKTYISKPRDVSGETYPYHPSSSQNNIGSNSSDSSLEQDDSSSQQSTNTIAPYYSEQYFSDFDSNYTESSRYTYANRAAPENQYNQLFGSANQYDNSDNHNNYIGNWGGTNILQNIPSSSPPEQISAEPSSSATPHNSSSETSSSKIEPDVPSNNSLSILPVLITVPICLGTITIVYFITKSKK